MKYLITFVLSIYLAHLWSEGFEAISIFFILWILFWWKIEYNEDRKKITPHYQPFYRGLKKRKDMKKTTRATIWALVFLVPAIILDVAQQIIKFLVTPVRVFLELRSYYVEKVN